MKLLDIALDIGLQPTADNIVIEQAMLEALETCFS